MDTVFTIGVYGFEADTFFGALERAGVDLLLDLRRRRGVRGREYAFANSTRLQLALAEHRIGYTHILDLAPDAETRAHQKMADVQTRTAPRKREVLSDAFVVAYTKQALEPFDWDRFVGLVGSAHRPALLCVERMPTACHRSLVAAELARRLGVEIVDLLP